MNPSEPPDDDRPTPPVPPPPRGRALPPPLPNVPTIVAVQPAPIVKFRRAHPLNYSSRVRGSMRLIVLHCTDGCEGTTKDDDAAAMFADPNLSPRRSAHYVVDADSITCCVPDAQTAWHCGHTGNAFGIGVEICGRASQTREEWLDATSLATLNLTARLVADLCDRHHVPATLVDAAGLQKGLTGITTHAYVSEAWHETTHTDPGKAFPLAALVIAVRKAMLKG